MAVDFMIMPLSRYLSGDFITPQMRFAWEQGIPYTIIGPEGRREFPPDEPFGGPSAAERREAIQTMLADDLRVLPREIARSPWNERSWQEPCFHRVDGASYAAFLNEANEREAPKGLFAFARRKRRAHVTATLFLPGAFDPVFLLRSPFERWVGSVIRAAAELRAGKWSPETLAARTGLLAALHDAAELSLPLLVDV